MIGRDKTRSENKSFRRQTHLLLDALLSSSYSQAPNPREPIKRDKKTVQEYQSEEKYAHAVLC